MRRVTLPRPSLGAHSATVSRAVAALPPVVLRARPSQELLIRVLQGVVLCQLLILGVILATAIAWALIAIPMTLIVLLFLREFEEARAGELAGDAAYEEPTTIFDPYAAEDSSIILVRRAAPAQTDAQVPAGRGNA